MAKQEEGAEPEINDGAHDLDACKDFFDVVKLKKRHKQLEGHIIDGLEDAGYSSHGTEWYRFAVRYCKKFRIGRWPELEKLFEKWCNEIHDPQNRVGLEYCYYYYFEMINEYVGRINWAAEKSRAPIPQSLLDHMTGADKADFEYYTKLLEENS